jgi:hypothetical protein
VEIRCNLIERIASLKEILCNEDNKIKKLKRQASYQRKSRGKKAKLLQENQEIIKYDSPSHPSLLIQYPDLHEHIHECIEFGAADKKRRKKLLKLEPSVTSKKNSIQNIMNIFLAPSSVITCYHLDQIL